MRHLHATGLIVGASVLQDEGMLFKPDRPFTGCRICGTLYQSDLDRLDHPTAEEQYDALELRKSWSMVHARTHTFKEHVSLELSQLWCTPEASQKLATYGVVAMGDMLVSTETEHAMRIASNRPADDVEGT